jgi:hypothetical protein
MRTLLDEYAGVTVELFPSYALGGKSDMRIRFVGGDTLDIEVKGAWSYGNVEWPPKLQKEGYRKYLVDRPEKCVLSDVHKLRRAQALQQCHVGMLLIGFDIGGTAKYTIYEPDIEELRERAGFVSSGWKEDYTEWPDDHQAAGPPRGVDGYRV